MASQPNGLRFSHLRPMDFGEILDQTIQVLKTGWKPLLLTGLIGAIPVIISTGLSNQLMPTTVNEDSLMTSWIFQALLRAERGNYTDLWQMGGIFALLTVVSLVMGLWVHAAMVVSASRIHLRLPVTLGMSLRIAGRRFWAMLGTYLLMAVFGVIAAVALGLAGLVFLAFLTIPIGFAVLAVYTVFVTPAIIIEEADGGMAPIKRSFRLVNRRFWPLLGLGIIFLIFSGVLSSQIQFITQIPLQWFMTFGVNPGLNPALGWVLAIIVGLVTAFTQPLYYTALTLAYYDTRIRKEGLDLEMMAAPGDRRE